MIEQRSVAARGCNGPARQAGGRFETVILVRHHPGLDGTHRVVLLGRLERDDAAGLGAVPDRLPADARHVRILASKLWTDDPEATRALAALADDLAGTGVPHSWVGCLPAVGRALTAAGHGTRLTGPGPDDVRAGAGWDGVVPLPPAPTRNPSVVWSVVKRSS